MAAERTRQPGRLSGAFELFGKSYDLVKKNFETFMILFSVSALLAIWDTLARLDDKNDSGDWKSSAANGIFGPSYDASFIAAAGGLITIVSVLSIVTYLMLVIASLRAAQGERLHLKKVWKEFTAKWLWLKLIGTFILLVLSIIAGLILLIIPGVILVWRLSLTPYVLIDQKTTISEAFVRSWEMTRGYAWPIYSIILVSILLSLTNVIPLIGSLVAFVLTSIYMLAPALRYQEIKNKK